jgi:hypothetical protein
MAIVFIAGKSNNQPPLVKGLGVVIAWFQVNIPRTLIFVLYLVPYMPLVSPDEGVSWKRGQHLDKRRSPRAFAIILLTTPPPLILTISARSSL